MAMTKKKNGLVSRLRWLAGGVCVLAFALGGAGMLQACDDDGDDKGSPDKTEEGSATIMPMTQMTMAISS